MILKDGTFYDFLDRCGDERNEDRAAILSKEQIHSLKRAYFIHKKTDDENPASWIYNECRDLRSFEKLIYETFDYYGHLDELTGCFEDDPKERKKARVLDEETNYKLKMLSFRYSLPQDIEAYTAKWLDKYVGVLVALQGPFNWRAHGYTEPPQDMVEYVSVSLERVLDYCEEICNRLADNPFARKEFVLKTGELFKAFADEGFVDPLQNFMNIYREEIHITPSTMRNFYVNNQPEHILSLNTVARSTDPIELEFQPFEAQAAKTGDRLGKVRKAA